MQQSRASNRHKVKKIFMKSLGVLLIGVLLCAHVYAGGTVGPDSKAASASAVTRSFGSNLVKVYYKSATIGRVEVSITNSNGEKIFNDVVHKTNGFVRPYSFRELPEGEYAVTIKDEYGRTTEKVSYTNESPEKLINVIKLGDDNKYIVTIASPQKDDFTISISDADSNIIYEEAARIGGEFAKVYSLKNVKNFSIEVSNARGVLKKVKY